MKKLLRWLFGKPRRKVAPPENLFEGVGDLLGPPRAVPDPLEPAGRLLMLLGDPLYYHLATATPKEAALMRKIIEVKYLVAQHMIEMLGKQHSDPGLTLEEIMAIRACPAWRDPLGEKSEEM